MVNRLKISGFMLFALWCVMADTTEVKAAPPTPWSADFPAWQQSVESRLDALAGKSAAKSGVASGTCANCPCTAPDCPKNAAQSVGSSVASPLVGTPVRVCENGVCRYVIVGGQQTGGISGLPDPFTGAFVGADFGQTVMTVSAGGCGDTGDSSPPTPLP